MAKNDNKAAQSGSKETTADLLNDAVTTAEGDVADEATKLEAEAKADVDKSNGFIAALAKQSRDAASAEAHAALSAVEIALSEARSKIAAAIEHAEGDVADFLAALHKHL